MLRLDQSLNNSTPHSNTGPERRAGGLGMSVSIRIGHQTYYNDDKISLGKTISELSLPNFYEYRYSIVPKYAYMLLGP